MEPPVSLLATSTISALAARRRPFVGGGVEYKLSPAWSAKVEYQYLDLDAEHFGKGVGPLGLGAGDQTQVNTVRVGLNWFLGSSFEPLK